MAKKSVLVIDDEPSVADALNLILGDRGCGVAVATTGRDALEAIGERRFDFVILDVRLPDMSGLAVLRKIRRDRPDLQVIIITAHHTPELADESLRLGAVSVLPKPFSPADLLEAMKIKSAV